MKHTIYLLTALLLLSLLSCHTEKGDPGPAGTSNLKQQGTVNGTLSYVNVKGDSVGYKFDYNFYDSDLSNQFNYDSINQSGYLIDFYRQEATESENGISISFIADMMVESPPQVPLTAAAGDVTYLAPTNDIAISFDFLKETGNNLFVFEANAQANAFNDGSSYTISNYSFNVKTGNLIFDYVIKFNYNDIQSPYNVSDEVDAVIKGSVNVILNRNPYNTNYNQGFKALKK